MTINDQLELWPDVKWPEPWRETSECVDCRRNAVQLGEWYMVHDDVWKAAGMETFGGALCIGCLEERLGRHQTADDFKDVPLNDLSYFPDANQRFSSRLRAALLRKKPIADEWRP
jgi:hypothetical protein